MALIVGSAAQRIKAEVALKLLADGLVEPGHMEYDPGKDSFGIRVRVDKFDDLDFPEAWVYIDLMVTGSWRLKQVVPLFPPGHIFYPNTGTLREWCYSGHKQPLLACIASYKAWDGRPYTEPVNWIKSYDPDRVQRRWSEPRDGVEQQGVLDPMVAEGLERYQLTGGL